LPQPSNVNLDLLLHASDCFDRIGCSGVGCTGEVRINRIDGDFAAWGIQILVSYRDGDNLQILTGSLQSGGARPLLSTCHQL